MNLSAIAKKVVIVGDQGVGKTCILQRLIENKFSATSLPTIGTSTQTYVMPTANGKPVTLALWDTAGQEQYHALSQVYFRDSQAAIVVYDATKSDAIETVLMWIRKYHDIVHNGFVVIAGNKMDLVKDVEEARVQSSAIEQEARAPVTLVSALTGEGVMQLFKSVADNIGSETYAQRMPEIRTRDEGGCC